jgi:LysM repeat protein
MFIAPLLIALVVPFAPHSGAGVAPAPARTTTVVVHAGQSLTSIAHAEHTTWLNLFEANRSVTDPNLIFPGQRLALAGHQQGPPIIAQPSPAALPAAPDISGPRNIPTPASAAYSGSGGYQSCVISHESGGNPRAVNASSGAGGLYQFLPSTWAGLGYSGLPQDASVAQQTAAFNTLYAEAGMAPWETDGCG